MIHRFHYNIVIINTKTYYTYRRAHKPQHSGHRTRKPQSLYGHQTHTTGCSHHSCSRLCSGRLGLKTKNALEEHKLKEYFTLQMYPVANKWRTPVCAKRRQICILTAGGAVVTDDWKQVIVGGLAGAVFSQKWLEVQSLKREGDMGAYLGREH